MTLGNHFSLTDYGYQVLLLGSWRDEKSLGLYGDLKIYNVIKTVPS